VTLGESLRELPPTAWLLFAGTFVKAATRALGRSRGDSASSSAERRHRALYAGRPGALWPACLALGILSAGLMLLGPARRVQPSPAHAAEAGPGMAR
jgi:hypothetical protein